MNVEYKGLFIGKYLVSDEKIAGGGEGDIYPVAQSAGLVAKIFREDKKTPEREEKLRNMVQLKLTEEQLDYITWPRDVIYDNQGRFAGYIMSRVDHVQSLTMLYSSEKFDLRYRLLAAYNLCASIDMIHSAGLICGDLNPQNIMINLDIEDKENGFHVVLVDADSYHFVTPQKTFRCEVGLPDYIAPEVQKKMVAGVSLKTAPLPTYSRQSDRFALAVHIFNLLMNGCHPFACAREVGNQVQTSMEQMTETFQKKSVVAPQPIENIKNGYFPFYEKRDGISIPMYAPEFSSLPSDIQQAFIQTFVGGFRNPEVRVTAGQWADIIRKYVIAANDRACVSCCPRGHYYFASNATCPLCTVEARFVQRIPEPKPMPSPKSLSMSQNNLVSSEENSEPSEIKKFDISQYFSRSRKPWLRVGAALIWEGLIVLIVALLIFAYENSSNQWKTHEFTNAGIEMEIPGDSSYTDNSEFVSIWSDMLECSYFTVSQMDYEDLELPSSVDEEAMDRYTQYFEDQDYDVDYGSDIVTLGEYDFLKVTVEGQEDDTRQYYATVCGDQWYECCAEYLGSDSEDFDEKDPNNLEKMIASMKIQN